MKNNVYQRLIGLTFLCLKSDIGKDQYIVVIASQRVLAVNVGNDTPCRTLDLHCNTNKRITIHVLHTARDLNWLGSVGNGRKKCCQE